MGANILIVEDEEPLTTLLRYNLEAEGYEVDAVARGDDADTRLKEAAPDLVVLDWMLPGLSGIELCRRLRARPQTQSLPIIMLTARGEESERVRGLATGADDYIVKPFSVPELLARVRALLRRASPERVAIVLTIGDLQSWLDTLGGAPAAREEASPRRWLGPKGPSLSSARRWAGSPASPCRAPSQAPRIAAMESVSPPAPIDSWSARRGVSP